MISPTSTVKKERKEIRSLTILAKLKQPAAASSKSRPKKIPNRRADASQVAAEAPALQETTASLRCKDCSEQWWFSASMSDAQSAYSSLIRTSQWPLYPSKLQERCQDQQRPRTKKPHYLIQRDATTFMPNRPATRLTGKASTVGRQYKQRAISLLITKAANSS